MTQSGSLQGPIKPGRLLHKMGRRNDGEELHCSWTQSCRIAGGNQWRMHASKQMPVHILECMNVFAGMIAIAALEGTDGRGKWTPVPEDYCGAQDQSAAYIPLWASVTHYSTWSPSSTNPSWTSPPRHLSPRTDNSPSLPFTPPSQCCVLASLLLHHPPPETKKTATRVLHVAFQSSKKTEGFRGDDSIRGSAN